MSRLKYLMENIEEILITILLPLMVVVIFVGTTGRYAKLFVLPWAEELARYLMIWVVFLGIGAGAKKNAHFVVEVLMLLLPTGLKKYLRIFTSLFIAAFMGILIYYSSSLIDRVRGMQQLSPSLAVPIWLVYLAIPVGCALMGVRTVQKCYRDLTADATYGQNQAQSNEAPELYE